MDKEALVPHEIRLNQDGKRVELWSHLGCFAMTLVTYGLLLGVIAGFYVDDPGRQIGFFIGFGTSAGCMWLFGALLNITLNDGFMKFRKAVPVKGDITTWLHAELTKPMEIKFFVNDRETKLDFTQDKEIEPPLEKKRYRLLVEHDKCDDLIDELFPLPRYVLIKVTHIIGSHDTETFAISAAINNQLSKRALKHNLNASVTSNFKPPSEYTVRVDTFPRGESWMEGMVTRVIASLLLLYPIFWYFKWRHVDCAIDIYVGGHLIVNKE